MEDILYKVRKEEDVLTDREEELVNETLTELRYKLRGIDRIEEDYPEVREALGKVSDYNIIRQLEKDIRKEPARMIEQSGFIHHQVPKLFNILTTYKKVKNLGDSIGDTEEKLEEALEVVSILGKEIENSYIDFKRIRVEELAEMNNMVGLHIKKDKERNNG